VPDCSTRTYSCGAALDLEIDMNRLLRPIRYLWYRCQSGNEYQAPNNACLWLEFLLLLNESTLFGLFGNKQILEDFFHGSISIGNIRCWEYFFCQYAFIWLLFGIQADKINNEFKSESIRQRRIRGYFVRTYVIATIIAVTIVGFINTPTGQRLVANLKTKI
jgi:hypothetical protein